MVLVNTLETGKTGRREDGKTTRRPLSRLDRKSKIPGKGKTLLRAIRGFDADRAETLPVYPSTRVRRERTPTPRLTQTYVPSRASAPENAAIDWTLIEHKERDDE